MVKVAKTAVPAGVEAIYPFSPETARWGRRALPLRRIRGALALAAMAMTAMADPKTVYYTLPDGVPDDGMTPVQRLTNAIANAVNGGNICRNEGTVRQKMGNRARRGIAQIKK